MMKTTQLLFAAIAAAAALYFASTPPAQALDDIAPPASFYDGDDHPAKTIGTLTVTNLKATAESQSVTNGQLLVTLTGLRNKLSPGPVGTNTVTLAPPGSAGIGRLVIIEVAPDVTNLLAIADSGTVALSSAFSGGPGDTLLLLGTSTGTWTQVATSNN